MNDPVYLDHNATTPVRPEVVAAMLPFLQEQFGNPSSGHVYGQRAKAAIALARAQVATLLGCEPSELTFTGSGTEATNLALRGLVCANPTRRHLVTSVIEHPATSEVCNALEREGVRVTRVGVDSAGQVRVGELASALTPSSLVSLIHAQNETGVLQPVVEVSKATQALGAWLHVDAAQSVGKIPVSVHQLGVDALTLVGHKFGAPKAVGALFVRGGLKLSPITYGAGHERGLRPGTENVSGIVGLGVACELASRDLDSSSKLMKSLRDRLFARLRDSIPGLELNGHPTQRLPNSVSVRFPGATGAAVLAACPEVAASTGSACHDGHDCAPEVIVAMGVSEADALGTVRLSLGRSTTEVEVDRSATALIDAWTRLRGR